MKPRVLLLGRDGYLGRALEQQLRARGQLVFSTSYRQPGAADDFNLNQPVLPEHLPPCTHALITGAQARIAACEQDPSGSAQINLHGPLATARALSARGILPVLFSTDYVFDGQQAPYSEHSPLSPLNAYGRQKAALEHQLEQHLPGQYLLLRLTKIYDHSPGTLITDMIQQLKQGQPLRVAHDQIMNPLHRQDLLSAIQMLLEQNQYGCWNLGGIEAFSRLELALQVAAKLELPAHLIEPIALSDLHESFQRPGDTRLDITRFCASFPAWQPRRLSDVLQQYQKTGLTCQASV